MTVKVCVMVLNFNGHKFLDECLSSLQNQSYPDYEVCLIDNGSSDGSIDYVKNKYPLVKVIRFEVNLGFACGYNKAARLVDSELLVFVNNDIKATPDWLKELVDVIDGNSSIAAVGSLLLFYDPPNLVNHEGAMLLPIGGGYDIGIYEPNYQGNTVPRPKEVGAVCGAAMLVRRSVFLEVGGFDSDLFAYYEDTDLCWRFWLFGYRVLLAPKSILFHKYGGSWGAETNPTRVYLGQKNRLLTMMKNLQVTTILKFLPISIAFFTMNIIKFFASQNIDAATAVVKANIWVVKNQKRILQKRISIQEKRVLLDRDLINRRLLATIGQCIIEFKRHESRRVLTTIRKNTNSRTSDANTRN